MTWLHFSVVALAITAFYSAHRGGLCFGTAAAFLDKAINGPAESVARICAFRALVEGYGYALLTVALAACAGFVAGRL